MPDHLTSNYLLACPFCGGTPRMATEYDPDGVKWHYITCPQCGARIRGQWHSPGNDCPLLRAEVRDQWNRRASVEPSAVDAEKLLEEYDACWIEDERLCNREHGPTRQAAKVMRERFNKARAAVLAAMRPAEPPTASREQQLLTELAYWKTRCGVMHGDETNAVTKSASECGACDKPGEHCANVHGICSRHGGRAHETSARRQCGCRTPGCTGCGEFP